jgi:proteic killer suppression protein
VVIVSFRHKGLRRFFDDNDASGIRPDHRARLAFILPLLDQATGPEDLTSIYTLRTHQLTGKLAGCWSVKVNGKLARRIRLSRR